MKIKKSGGPDDEAKFASMLESYHEALLDGGARSFNEARDDEPVDPELVRARRCVRMLEELRCTSEDTRTAYASLFHDLPGADEWTDDKTPSELGRFQILEQLGRGGQGIIYRALDPVLDREVALKIPRPSAVVSHDLRRRFLQEARAVALLNHPHLIPVHDVGFAGPICYIASAYCRGETLEKWLREQKDLPSFHAAADLVSVLAETVNYVHRQGILHRDLKPSNVLLEQPSTASLQSGPWPNELSTFTPRLTDFGLAKLLHAPAGETATGTFLGTPAYMAPEQAEARRHDIGPPTDVYALGVMLYELLVGRPPFRGQSPLETLRQINEGNFTAPRRARRTVPRDLEAICLKCMELRPADRYQTASDLAADLKRFLSRRPVTARPVTPIARLVKWSRRKPLVAALGALLMFSTFCGLAGVTWQWRRAQVLGEQSRVRLVRQYVDRGVAALERGDYAGSLPWLLEALTWEKPDSTSAHAQLFRIGAVLQRCPRLTQFLYHDVSLKFAEFSVDGRFVAVAALDAYGRIWDAKSGKLLGAPLAHGDYVLCARIDSSGEWAMTCGTNNVARIWNLASGQPACPPLEHPSGVIWAEFSPSGKLVVTTSNSGAVRVWSVPAGQAVTGWLSHEARVECATFSSDEKLVATACSDGKARIWDIASSRAVITATHQGAVHSVELTGDDQLMLTGGDDFAARIWHVGTGQQVTPPLRHEMIVNSAHFSSNDRLVVTASSDHSARVWDSKTGSPISPPLVHDSAVYHAQFSPDSRLVVTASWDHTARVWEAKTGRPITPPLMHAHFVVRASFSPDGMNVLTCSVDGAARIWQLPTENTDVRVLPHNSAVREAVFQPHSHHVLTLDASGNVHVWDGTRGHEFTSCLDRGEPVTRMAINRDGSKVAMVHGNRVSVWDMPANSTDMPKKSMSIGTLIEDGPIDQMGLSQSIVFDAV